MQASSYGVPGLSVGFLGPSAYKSAHTHFWVQTSSIFIRELALKFLTPVYTPKPTIIDVVFYPRVKFPTLILEHHNDSLMLLYVNMLCFFFLLFSVCSFIFKLILSSGCHLGILPPQAALTVQNYKEKLKGQRKREKNLRFAPLILSLIF